MQFQRLRVDVLMRDNTKTSFYTAFRPPKTLFLCFWARGTDS